MKKLVCLLLALLLLGSSAALAANSVELINKDGLVPIVNEKVEFSFLYRGDGSLIPEDDFWFFDFCDQFLNIKLNEERVDVSIFREKLNIYMSTDSMPDMIMSSATIWGEDVLQWGMLDQQFLKIDEYWDYCPQFYAELHKQPELVRQVTLPDGHIYGFSNIFVVNPGQSMGIFTITNTQWLENIGMDMPTTLDEFFDMLIAFRDLDVNGHGADSYRVPWAGTFNGGYPERIFVFWAYGYNGYRWPMFDYTNGIGYFAPYVPEYKEIIGFMKKCYDENLFQDVMFSGDGAASLAFALENTDTSYYGFSVDWGREGMAGNNPDLYSHFSAQIPVVANDSIVRTTWKGSNIDLNTIVINSNVDKPEIACKFADIWYDPYFALMWNYGPEFDTDFDIYGNGWVYFSDEDTQMFYYPSNPNFDPDNPHSNEPENKTPNFNRLKNSIMDGASFGLNPGTALGYWDPESRWDKGWSEETRRWNDTLAENNYPYEMYELSDYLYFVGDDLDFFNANRMPLQNFMMAQEAMFITGERDWAEWDDYMAEMDAMGGRAFNDFLQEKMAEFINRGGPQKSY